MVFDSCQNLKYMIGNLIGFQIAGAGNFNYKS